MAPELTRTGRPTTSSDVFAFGAFLLEVVCGRRPIEFKALPEELILVEWVWERWKQGDVLDVVDKRLGGEYDENEVVVVIKLGLMCSNSVAARRPSMRQVVRYLDGEEGLLEVVARPLEECEVNKGGGGGEFENFEDSYEKSSYFEKAGLDSWGGDRDVDIEAGSWVFLFLFTNLVVSQSDEFTFHGFKGNVLLDSEFNGRLGDFGLAKLSKHGSNPDTTRVVGTLGYLAPELTRTGRPTTSSDVFAFGAFLLEVVCGRRPIEQKALPEELILVEWVWERWKEGAVLDVVDKRLGGEYNENEVVVVIKLGLMCSNSVVARRPSMRQVVRYLDGEEGLLEVVAPPSEECEVNKGGGGGEFENFEDSCEKSSYFEKVDLDSWGGDRDVDIEAGR
ncbi:hypothetical protein Vadar_005880 [Vaccinium darrowii]|uniref:Uncharacterized protein n=1 Tax=Vaccinium darrowii TaxID=229202 RepID=A0ACB7XFM4_9ERIC|nr:hypothetical protein Vadar_005880 [Vaccinium darrowii]